MLSGFVLAVDIVSVVAGAAVLVLSALTESELVVDMEDSFVPQLTANIPTVAINNNFFIIFYFGVIVTRVIQLLFRKYW